MEADRLMSELDAELALDEGQRATWANSAELTLAKRLVAWLADEAAGGRRPDRSPTYGSLSQMVADGFNPRSALANDLIGFERSVGRAVARSVE